jgi:hypothetical protein
MKLIGKSALVLMLGVLVLASAASAGYTLSSIGGVSSSASNGAASGTSISFLNYQDNGLGVLFLPEVQGGNLGTFNDVLTEEMNTNAHVVDGQIGDASAGWDTKGTKSFLQALPTLTYNTNAYISTSLQGTVVASVSKTSLNGVADATASMMAQSAASPINRTLPFAYKNQPALGGTAELFASVSHNGAGSGLAEANGEATHSSSIANLSAFSFGHASGDAKVSGSNDVFGGLVSGTADIYAGTYLKGVGTSTLPKNVSQGTSITLEDINLSASRGISYEGNSNIQATLTGSEAGETKLALLNQSTTKGTKTYSGALAQPTVVDNEATSVMDGTTIALNRHDNATTHVLLRTETGTDGLNATSDATMYGFAKVNRDSTGSANKSIAEGYLSEASWTTSTLLPNKNYASISGLNGFTPDGGPTPDAGLGVGAWISNPFISPVTATASQTELASTGKITKGTIPGMIGLAFTNTVATQFPTGPVVFEKYSMSLNGRTITGVTNDAVGAFLGVGKQTLLESNATTAGIPGNIPPILAGTTMSLTQDARNGIEWLEGNNPNLMPGHYTSNVLPNGITQTATTRSSGLLGMNTTVVISHP